ncbi:hypothetical protein GIB67_039831 [Kingdonia uniflora]|uniref:RNA ligase/cyclic nucleotide phosphodiesterase family protein n=1 Tax=Kingdonia uniflora TaxID=39325 RepID=A0A7J7P3G5_9MAGN|nr:hypothetical protein GIB67_039831 [Kingdonia uniflora]
MEEPKGGSSDAAERQSHKFVYSVWAIPPKENTDQFKKVMNGLILEFGGPEFQPHITVVGAITLTESDALLKFKSVCKGLKPYPVRIDTVSTGTFFYQCVYLLLHPTPEVMETSVHCSGHFGYKSSTRVEIDIDGMKINHHDVLTETEVPRATDSVGGVGEDALEIEAGVVTEDSMRFDGVGVKMNHYKETTERKGYRAKDGDVLKSYRSKSHDGVAILMREVHLIDDSDYHEVQPKNTNTTPKLILGVRQTEEWGCADLFGSDEQNYGIEEEVISDYKMRVSPRSTSFLSKSTSSSILKSKRFLMKL